MQPMRTQAANDNSQASNRVDPGGAYGPDSCVNGYVWREAFQGDLVCVTPDVRTQAANDNSQASSRVDPNAAYGPDACLTGYVWREAFQGDLVCVTPDVRAQAADDNNHASERIRQLLFLFLSELVGLPKYFTIHRPSSSLIEYKVNSI